MRSPVFNRSSRTYAVAFIATLSAFSVAVQTAFASEMRRFSVVEQDQSSSAWDGMVASDARHLNLSDAGIDSRCRDITAVEARVRLFMKSHCESSRAVTGSESAALECGDYRFECANPEKLKSLNCYYLFKGASEIAANPRCKAADQVIDGRTGRPVSSSPVPAPEISNPSYEVYIERPQINRNGDSYFEFLVPVDSSLDQALAVKLQAEQNRLSDPTVRPATLFTLRRWIKGQKIVRAGKTERDWVEVVQECSTLSTPYFSELAKVKKTRKQVQAGSSLPTPENTEEYRVYSCDVDMSIGVFPSDFVPENPAERPDPNDSRLMPGEWMLFLEGVSINGSTPVDIRVADSVFVVTPPPKEQKDPEVNSKLLNAFSNPNTAVKEMAAATGATSKDYVPSVTTTPQSKDQASQAPVDSTGGDLSGKVCSAAAYGFDKLRFETNSTSHIGLAPMGAFAGCSLALGDQNFGVVLNALANAGLSAGIDLSKGSQPSEISTGTLKKGQSSNAESETFWNQIKSTSVMGAAASAGAHLKAAIFSKVLHVAGIEFGGRVGYKADVSKLGANDSFDSEFFKRLTILGYVIDLSSISNDDKPSYKPDSKSPDVLAYMSSKPCYQLQAGGNGMTSASSSVYASDRAYDIVFRPEASGSQTSSDGCGSGSAGFGFEFLSIDLSPEPQPITKFSVGPVPVGIYWRPFGVVSLKGSLTLPRSLSGNWSTSSSPGIGILAGPEVVTGVQVFGTAEYEFIKAGIKAQLDLFSGMIGINPTLNARAKGTQIQEDAQALKDAQALVENQTAGALISGDSKNDLISKASADLKAAVNTMLSINLMGGFQALSGEVNAVMFADGSMIKKMLGFTANEADWYKVFDWRILSWDAPLKCFFSKPLGCWNLDTGWGSCGKSDDPIAACLSISSSRSKNSKIEDNTSFVESNQRGGRGCFEYRVTALGSESALVQNFGFPGEVRHFLIENVTKCAPGYSNDGVLAFVASDWGEGLPQLNTGNVIFKRADVSRRLPSLSESKRKILLGAYGLPENTPECYDETPLKGDPKWARSKMLNGLQGLDQWGNRYGSVVDEPLNDPSNQRKCVLSVQADPQTSTAYAKSSLSLRRLWWESSDGWSFTQKTEVLPSALRMSYRAGYRLNYPGASGAPLRACVGEFVHYPLRDLVMGSTAAKWNQVKAPQGAKWIWGIQTISGGYGIVGDVIKIDPDTAEIVSVVNTRNGRAYSERVTPLGLDAQFKVFAQLVPTDGELTELKFDGVHGFDGKPLDFASQANQKVRFESEVMRLVLEPCETELAPIADYDFGAVERMTENDSAFKLDLASARRGSVMITDIAWRSNAGPYFTQYQKDSSSCAIGSEIRADAGCSIGISYEPSADCKAESISQLVVRYTTSRSSAPKERFLTVRGKRACGGNPTTLAYEPSSAWVCKDQVVDGKFKLADATARGERLRFSIEAVAADRALPQGLTIDEVSGAISGQISQIGVYPFFVRLSHADNRGPASSVKTSLILDVKDCNGGVGSSGAGGGRTGPLRVFIATNDSGGFTGNLGGVSGADVICQQSADAGNLGGQWKAWLTDSRTTALDHIVGNGPWYLVDEKTKVFDSKASLMSAPLTSIKYDQNKLRVMDNLTTPVRVWTGTEEQNGIGAHCSNWTSDSASVLGHTGEMSERNLTGWTFMDPARLCNSRAYLYCFEMGSPQAPTPTSTPTKRVFRTSTLYSIDQWMQGGAMAADGICQVHAEQAGLGGVFQAWLQDGTRGLTALERLRGEGPWHLTGTGARVFASKSAIARDGRPEVHIDHDERGRPNADPGGVGQVYSGAGSRGERASNSCTDFMDRYSYGSTITFGIGSASFPLAGWSQRLDRNGVPEVTQCGTISSEAAAGFYCFETDGANGVGGGTGVLNPMTDCATTWNYGMFVTRSDKPERKIADLSQIPAPRYGQNLCEQEVLICPTNAGGSVPNSMVSLFSDATGDLPFSTVNTSSLQNVTLDNGMVCKKISIPANIPLGTALQSLVMPSSSGIAVIQRLKYCCYAVVGGSGGETTLPPPPSGSSGGTGALSP